MRAPGASTGQGARARYDTRWWGWGDPGRRTALPPEAVALLRARIGELQPRSHVSLEEVAISDSRRLPDSVIAAVGPQRITSLHEDRVRHAAGKGYPDLIRLRTGRLERAPDAVLFPAGVEQVSAVLAACAREGVAVVPFGGGTSVVGGVDPAPGQFERLVSLNLRDFRRVEIDHRSLTALLGAGLRGPEAEKALSARGFTLGHFPQSFEYATIGGFAATRSAGQASSGYGRFDELITSVRLIAPAGELSTLETPHSAAGPSLRELVVGSEGILGAITEVAVRVRPAPEARRYEAWMAPGFEEGAEVVRAMAQQDALPDVLRLSDRTETEISMALSGMGGLARQALGAYLRLRRRPEGCIMIVGWEGGREAVTRRRAVGTRLLRSGGAVPLGPAPGRAWERGRYHGPYLRDGLLDAGVMVETLETAHTWSRLDEVYGGVSGAIGAAMREEGTPGIVMCHISHAYPDGASLYFTFLARQRDGAEIAQWRAVKGAASRAIVRTGATITHHHAVGRDHAPYMPAEIGELGVEVLRGAKERLDPAGIMNPGKLLAA